MVEKNGFMGYRVKITQSEDPDRVGDVVGARSQGIEKISCTNLQSGTQSGKKIKKFYLFSL